MARLGSAPSHGYQVAETITATKTLTDGDAGKLLYLDSANGAYTITMPSVRAGLHYKFVVQEDTPTGAITIAMGSAIGFGKVRENEVDSGDDGPGSSGATGVSNVIIGTNTNKGDWLEFDCDGTSWYFRGVTSNDGDVTTS
ncbi:MAG: hypothetical protein H8D23_18350 [Candidatus Brocadiales bacterium]|nr:hypothetical protein [Candidatus Brocadiales bacterium]